MVFVRSENMPDEEERKAIIGYMDAMFSVGASWPQVQLELLRISREPQAPFKVVPSQSTLERMLCEAFECDGLTEYRAKRKDAIKVTLQTKALSMAMAGNVPMLIFCLKNICGWTDNIKMIDPNANDPDKGKITLAYSKGDLKRKGKGKTS